MSDPTGSVFVVVVQYNSSHGGDPEDDKQYNLRAFLSEEAAENHIRAIEVEAARLNGLVPPEPGCWLGRDYDRAESGCLYWNKWLGGKKLVGGEVPTTMWALDPYRFSCNMSGMWRKCSYYYVVDEVDLF